MKKHKYFILCGLMLVILMIGCKPKFDIPDPDKGNIDPTKYVAIGNSLTAGYADGALYYEAQENSFTAILAHQLTMIGGGTYSIPYVPQNSNGLSIIAGNTVNVAAKMMLGNKTDCKSITSLSPIRLTTTDNYGSFANTVYNTMGPFNNMGVPDAKAIHITYKGYGNSANMGSGYYNPFFQRIASNTTMASILSDAVNQNPTFFSLLIGSNDALSYALTGGTADTITSEARFDAHIDTIIAQLTKNGAKGVVGNIPDISALPYFTTIPYNGLNIDQAQADQLNGLYEPLGIGIHFSPGSNNFIIQDASATLGLRQIQEGEFILLNVPLDSVKCHNIGSLIPIPNKYVLTANEISLIQAAINHYNNKLQSAAQTKGLAFVDVKGLFNTFKSGITYNGISLNAQFVKGGVFSLDGIQLNPIGQALLANEFIKSINAMYQSTVPLVDATKYRGNVFP